MILPETGRGTSEAGGGEVPRAHAPGVERARQLRRTMTLPEVILWQRLRGAQVGTKFRRQHPIGPYIVDFYCREERLVIEVDGDVHNRCDRPARDKLRERFLNENKYRVLRISAEDILSNLAGVIDSITARVASPLHHAAHGPPPRAGEDL